MLYKDRVYGEFKIREPIILELINSPSLQRLKDIDQAGYKPLWVKPDFNIGEYDHSRFAHSLGVYLLLRKYNATIEEQIAGLIHDVSHSAFSHCIDYVLDSGSEEKQSHQDNVFNEFVKNSEIPIILKKYNFDLEYILNDKNFTLKEKELPDLCADRIDYSLRGALLFNELSAEGVKYFLDNLVTENNNWIFKEFEPAKKYAELFLRLNKKYYSGLNSAVMFRTVGDYLRYALKKSYISKDDLYTTDEIVLSKIEKHFKDDGQLRLFYERMNKKIKTNNNFENYDAQVLCKSRVVNPLCKDNGEIKQLSVIDTDWAKVLKQESKPKQYFLKFEK